MVVGFNLANFDMPAEFRCDAFMFVKNQNFASEYQFMPCKSNS